MRKSAIKRRCAKIASIAVSLTMAAGMLSTSTFASAATSDKLNANKKYESQYDSYDEVLEAGKELNVELAGEGFTLLKNRNNALPFARTERKVTVLGSYADTLSTGGSGSGSQRRPGNGTASTVASEEAATIFESLEAVGIKANPRVRERYLTVNPVSATFNSGSYFGDTSITYANAKYMDLVESNGEVAFAGKQYKSAANSSLAGADNNLSLYDDAAIVVISRSGGEGADNKSNRVPGHTDESDHYLELNDSERELMAYAKLHFNKIVVIVNSPSVMELGDLQDDDGIGAILWVGQPGWNGIMAVGKILTGEINPSGKTVDFYMRKFESDPTWYNFGNYTHADYLVNGEFTDRTSTVEMKKRATCEYETGSNFGDSANAIDYAEGIYMGYRYYETVAAELTKAGKDGEAWYQSEVVYPFGYGLSYTTFSQKIIDIEGDLSNADGEIIVKVKVTNTGYVAGKDIVQLYNTPDYVPGEIDKAEVNLVGFTKTDVIKAGQSQTVEITVPVKDLASFDYNDANGNDYCGYELEKGSYKLSIRSDSHTELDSRTLNASEAKYWDEDGNPETPNNIFSQPLEGEGSEWGRYNTLAHNWTESGENHYLTRDKLVDEDGEVYDLKNLAWLLTDDNMFKDVCIKLLAERYGGYSYDDWDNALTEEVETDYTNVWTKTEADIPANWTQGTGVVQNATGRYKIELYDMIGIDPNGTTPVVSANTEINGKTGKEAWITFMNQLSWSDLTDLVLSRNGANAIDKIGKYSVADADGPGQFSGGWAWVCEVVIASTWNTDLGYQQGVIVGNESLWKGTNGWWGPGMDIHRNPLAGRNFEYYSQDGLQGGLMAAAVVKGATDMGCHVFVKHAFLNDQETNRVGTSTFLTEQAIREIYAKCFELSVKRGNADGLMSSFNLIGLESSASYAVNYQLYKNEWGFEGYSITDMYGEGKTGSAWPSWMLIRGNTVPLGSALSNKTENYDNNSSDGTWNADKRDGKGMVTVPAYDAETGKPSASEQKDSPTLWYYTRNLAQNILYNQVNGNATKAGYAPYMISANTSLNLKQHAEIAKDTNILSGNALTQLESVFTHSGYTLTATGLPAGVTLEENGVLTGTPTKAGTFKVKVTVTGKNGLGYITDTQEITLTVADFTENLNDKVVLSNKTATLGTAYTGSVSGDPVTLVEGTNYVPNGEAIEANKDKYVSQSYTAEGLPAGLTIDKQTGAISGTPTEVGTFRVSVNVVYGKVSEAQGGGRPGGGPGGGRPTSYEIKDEAYTSVYKFTVDGGFNVTFDANCDGGSVQNIGVATYSTAKFSDMEVATPVNGTNVFVGWATSPNADRPDVTDDITFDKATTLYAVWKMPAVAIVDGELYLNGEATGIILEVQDGIDGINGVDGTDGVDGANGKGIASAVINADGELELTYTDGEKVNLGKVVGANGTNGQDGKDGQDGKPAEGGCNGSIASTAIPVTFALAIALGAVVIAKKSNNGKNKQ